MSNPDIKYTGESALRLLIKYMASLDAKIESGTGSGGGSIGDVPILTEDDIRALFDELDIDIDDIGHSALKGRDGTGIDGIELLRGTGLPGTTDTYVIKLTDGRSFQFTVYNGADGKNGKDGSSADVDMSAISNHIADKNNPHKLTAAQVNAVPTTRTINGQSLDKDITLDAASVNARPDDWMPTASDIGALSSTGSAASAKKLTTSQSIQTDLSSGSAASFNGTAGVRPGVTGVLPVAYGGTGATDAATALSTLTNVTSLTLGRNAATNDSNGISIGHNAIGLGREAIAIGYNAAINGSDSVAIGWKANCASSYAVAIGGASYALGGVAIGWMANAGPSSVAVGGRAYDSASVAIGLSEVKGGQCIGIIGSIPCNIGWSNAIGTGCSVTADYSTALGCMSDVTGRCSMAFGYYANTSEANTIQLGSTVYLSNLRCRVGLTTGSDIRDKTDIHQLDDGAVKFLNAIHPIRYVLNERLKYVPLPDEQTDQQKELMSRYGLCDYDKEAYARGDKKGSRIRVGVSAQEVQQALIDIYGDASYGNIVDDNFYDLDKSTIPEGVENKLSVAYSNFIPFLIKAVQELDARISSMENH